MKTTEVRFHMGVTVPHPTLQFSNIRLQVGYTIQIEPEDDTKAWEAAQTKLRLRAEEFLERSLRQTIRECREREEKRQAAIQIACDARNAQRDADVPF